MNISEYFYLIAVGISFTALLLYLSQFHENIVKALSNLSLFTSTLSLVYMYKLEWSLFGFRLGHIEVVFISFLVLLWVNLFRWYLSRARDVLLTSIVPCISIWMWTPVDLITYFGLCILLFILIQIILNSDQSRVDGSQTTTFILSFFTIPLFIMGLSAILISTGGLDPYSMFLPSIVGGAGIVLVSALMFTLIGIFPFNLAIEKVLTSSMRIEGLAIFILWIYVPATINSLTILNSMVSSLEHGHGASAISFIASICILSALYLSLTCLSIQNKQKLLARMFLALTSSMVSLALIDKDLIQIDFIFLVIIYHAFAFLGIWVIVKWGEGSMAKYFISKPLVFASIFLLMGVPPTQSYFLRLELISSLMAQREYLYIATLIATLLVVFIRIKDLAGIESVTMPKDTQMDFRSKNSFSHIASISIFLVCALFFAVYPIL